MERRELICIGCPLGCSLTVSMEGAEVVSVTGNTCKRGDVYARKEVTNPTRIVTSTVKVSNGTADMVSVKTKEDVPKEKIFDCMRALKDVTVQAPVHIGDVVLKNVAGTGVDMVATKNVDWREPGQKKGEAYDHGEKEPGAGKHERDDRSGSQDLRDQRHELPGRGGEGADSERYERDEPGGRNELQPQRYELFEKKIKLLQLLLECDMM